MTASPERRIGLVLSAGGLRGASHLGVIRQLARHRIPTEAIVETSVGALIAAYYAAVGLTVDEMMHDARVFLGRHLLAHSLAVRAWGVCGAGLNISGSRGTRRQARPSTALDTAQP